MNIAITLFVLANMAISITLLLLWLRGREQSQALLLEAAALAADNAVIPAKLHKLLIEQNKRIITVEILNPTELAIAKTALAKPFVGLAPDTINKLVYKEARDIIAKQLPSFGVNAEVKIHVT
jgi:hypothetical protein